MTNIVNVTHIKTCLDSLITDGMVTMLKQNDSDFPIIKTFWKDTYPNSRENTMLFILNENWDQEIELFLNEMKKYFTTFEISKLRRRAKEYSRYYETIKAEQSPYTDEDAIIAECANEGCPRKITSRMTPSVDYVKYPIGLICMSCNRRALKTNPQLIKKWRT